MQLAAAVNNLSSRLGTETPVAEMPHHVNIPLATMPEVEEFEEWLKDSRNAQDKQNMVFNFFLSYVMIAVELFNVAILYSLLSYILRCLI